MRMQRVIKKTSYHEQVYNLLREDILSGRLKSGERINENAIAKSFSVSRSPVREAIRMLEQDEILVSTRTGLIVNPLEPARLQQVYECRMVLEAYAARAAADAISPAQIEALRGCVNDARAAHGAKDVEKVVDANTRFHESIVGFCQNQSLQSMIAKHRALSLMARRQEFFRYHKQGNDYLCEHEAIVDAIVQRDPDAIECAVRRHIGNDLHFYREHALKG